MNISNYSLKILNILIIDRRIKGGAYNGQNRTQA